MWRNIESRSRTRFDSKNYIVLPLNQAPKPTEKPTIRGCTIRSSHFADSADNRPRSYHFRRNGRDRDRHFDGQDRAWIYRLASDLYRSQIRLGAITPESAILLYLIRLRALFIKFNHLASFIFRITLIACISSHC